MPNHVRNNLVATGPLHELTRFANQAASDSQSISFEKFIDPVNVDPIGYIKDWYDWSVRHWGTKWDAYETGELTIDVGRSKLQVQFLTAWSTPNAALITISEQFPELTFTVDSEQEWGEGETYTYRDGIETQTRVWSTRSKGPRSLARR